MWRPLAFQLPSSSRTQNEQTKATSRIPTCEWACVQNLSYANYIVARRFCSADFFCDLDVFVPEGIAAREWNARELLLHLKDALPFIFRYEATHYRSGSTKYNDITISVPRADMTVKELLNLIVAGFPETWQATFFPGRVIFYEERRNYAHATDVVRKS